MSEDDEEEDSDAKASEDDEEESYTGRPKVAPIPTGGIASNFSIRKLQAEGWDPAHIELVSRIAYRGRQRVLPQSWERTFYWMPTGLFAPHDTPFLRSWNKSTAHGEAAFDRMLRYLGSSVRSGLQDGGGRSPEQRLRMFLKSYMRYAMSDSNLDQNRALPVIKLIIAPQTTDDQVLVARATQSLTRLAAQFKEIGSSMPKELISPSNVGAVHVPTLYAIVASGGMVALAALRADDESQTLQPVAFFDFGNFDHEFWNTLALAMIVCHGRNVQMHIADKTGIGLRDPNEPMAIDSDE